MHTGTLYSATVEAVHSGDDLVLLVDLGVDGLFKKVRVRLHGVDTPDAFKAGADTAAGTVRDDVRKLLGGSCRVGIVAQARGVWIVKVYIKGDVCLNDLLISRGYAHTNITGQKESRNVRTAC